MFQQNLRNQSPTFLWHCDFFHLEQCVPGILEGMVACHNGLKRKSPFVLIPGRSMVCCMAIFYSSGSNWIWQTSTQCEKNIDLTIEGHASSFQKFTQWNYFAVFMFVQAFKIHHTYVPFVLTPGRSMVCCMAIFYSSGSNWRKQRSTQCQKNIDVLEITLQFLCLCMVSKNTPHKRSCCTVLLNFCSLVVNGTFHFSDRPRM